VQTSQKKPGQCFSNDLKASCKNSANLEQNKFQNHQLVFLMFNSLMKMFKSWLVNLEKIIITKLMP